MSTRPELNLDRETFLARYWQRKPLLIRNAIQDFTPPLDSDELAGLAMENEVESRLIEQDNNNWQLHHGPFKETDFQRTNPWTLLVQGVDHYIPEVAALRRLVDFIPQWRVDDVMVSYAVDGGSAGPHYDNYDVFLLQGLGKRQWSLGQFCDNSTPLLPFDELRILESFDLQEEYILECGDILYVPPGYAHWGIAVGECTTFSIGFRAPRMADMVSRWADQLLERGIDNDQFLRDEKRTPLTRPGEIHAGDIERVRAQLQGALDQASDEQWFGELVTEPRDSQYYHDDELAAARALLPDNAELIELSPAARLAWQQGEESIRVFANGDSREFSELVLPALLSLCGDWRLEGANLEATLSESDAAAMLDFLLECGVIHVR